MHDPARLRERDCVVYSEKRRAKKINHIGHFDLSLGYTAARKLS